MARTTKRSGRLRLGDHEETTPRPPGHSPSAVPHIPVDGSKASPKLLAGFESTANMLSPRPGKIQEDSGAQPKCFPQVLARFTRTGQSFFPSIAMCCNLAFCETRPHRPSVKQKDEAQNRHHATAGEACGERCVQDMAQECWPTLSPLRRPIVGTTLCGTSRPGDTGSTTTMTTNATTTTANTTATARKTARTTRAARMNIRD